MSRRPADKAAQNTQVIKNLLRMETNKTCADCKKNKRELAPWSRACVRLTVSRSPMGELESGCVRVYSVRMDLSPDFGPLANRLEDAPVFTVVWEHTLVE